MIVIVDYGAGNLRSVAKALEWLGAEHLVSHQAKDVAAATAVVLPGVGAAKDIMGSLRRLELVETLKEAIASKPYLGICMGLQVLLDGSEEGGWETCLGIIPGVVRRLPQDRRVPHIGWNQVKQKVQHPIFADIPDNANFYFVHSYFPHPQDNALVAAETEYGLIFASIVARGNLVATQFHPEKSGHWGLKLLENFLRLVERSQHCS